MSLCAGGLLGKCKRSDKEKSGLRAALFMLFTIKFIFLSEKIVIFAVIKFE